MGGTMTVLAAGSPNPSCLPALPMHTRVKIRSLIRVTYVALGRENLTMREFAHIGVATCTSQKTVNALLKLISP